MSQKNKKNDFEGEVGSENLEKGEVEKEQPDNKEKKPTDLKEALASAEDYKRKWYTVTAEYENFRKRNASSVANAYRDGIAETVLKFLPVADNFGYAYDMAKDEKTKEGIDKVKKSFSAILASFGIEEIVINPGDPFDESIAEAIMNYPCAEGETPNTVKFVLKKGYKSRDKVVRYAQVAVTV